MPEIIYRPHGRDAYSCVLTTSSGASLTVKGTMPAGAVEVEGTEALRSNLTLATSLAAYARSEALFRRLRAVEKRDSHRKEAARHRKVALLVADMIERPGSTVGRGWCSACYADCEHRSVKGMGWPAYLCQECGAPTRKCAVPRCGGFAVRGSRHATTPRYCAEHRHDIPSFARLTARLPRLEDYDSWLDFDKPNASKVTKGAAVTVLSAAALAPAAFLAAPMLGGAAGALTGLSGAAATSHGLALFGGGSLAAGGFGMAGGTAVLTAVGTALGGATGATITSAYVRADPSFRIERLDEATDASEGPPVVFASGFLTEGQTGWGGWEPMIRRRYPHNPVYRVHWGAKELRALGLILGTNVGQKALQKAVVGYALKASKRAVAKIGPLGNLLLAAGLAKNPWTVAMTRASMTGAVLADLLARTDEDAFVLIGHSLGARVMVTAAQNLGTRHTSPPRVEEIHLLGAAVSVGGDWGTLNAAVRTKVFNYWSDRDEVLKRLYTGAQLGKRAVGCRGFRSSFPNIVDRNVSRRVDRHSAYLANVTLS